MRDLIMTGNTVVESPETGERVVLVEGERVPDWARSPDPNTPGLIGSHLYEAVGELDQPDPPVDEAPKGNASRDEWAAYAASKGAPEEETRPVDEGGLKHADLKDKYGK